MHIVYLNTHIHIRALNFFLKDNNKKCSFGLRLGLLECQNNTCSAATDKSRDGLSYVTLAELNQLKSRLRIDRGLTSARLKESIGLHVSTRTVRNYINLLGWRSIRTKFCQYVSEKNRIERLLW